ncbi:MAG: T9SS type A sorting domain-containing protein [Flavobacteriales bacterium]
MRTSLALSFLLATASVCAQNTFDARILSYEGLQYACDGSVDPRLKIQNVGTQTMTTCVVETWKNGLLQNSFNWVLATAALSGDIRQPSLPPIAVEEGDALEFRIISVNEQPDQGPEGNVIQQALTGAVEACALQTVEVEVLADPAADEITWSLRNAQGALLAQGGPYAEAGTYSSWVTLPADACLSLDLNDAGGNGITGGRLTVRCASSDLVQIEGDTFTDRATTGLRTGSIVGMSEPVARERLRLIPNPATTSVRVQIGEVVGAVELNVYDATGRSVRSRSASSGTSAVDVDLSGLARGLHVVQVRHAGGLLTERLIVQ